MTIPVALTLPLTVLVLRNNTESVYPPSPRQIIEVPW